MTVYEELMEHVENGDSFHIDFEKKTLKIGKKTIKLLEQDRKLIEYDENNDVLYDIEELYSKYKYSIPSERSDSKRKQYFKALPVEKLTDAQMVYGQRREVAQAALEGFVLCAVLSGHLVWEDFQTGGWFWQSQNDTDLVVLKSWIQNN